MNYLKNAYIFLNIILAESADKFLAFCIEIKKVPHCGTFLPFTHFRIYEFIIILPKTFNNSAFNIYNSGSVTVCVGEIFLFDPTNKVLRYMIPVVIGFNPASYAYHSRA